MKRVAVIWGFALVCLLLEGAAARWLPRAACPDLGLVLAVAAGLRLAGVTGCAAAWGVGWMADLVSGSALGYFALLRLMAWALTRLAQGQFHLRQPLLLMGFVAALSVAEAGLVAAAGGGALGLDSGTLAPVASHAAVNALVAPFGVRVVLQVLDALGDGDGARPPLRLPVRSLLS